MSKLPFDPNHLDPQEHAIYDQMVAKRKSQGAPFGGPYAALMNHPDLCEKIEALGYYLKFLGHLPRDVYQFIVLTVAKATKADFEWEDHVHHALSAGVPSDVIQKIKTGDIEKPSFSDPYQCAAEVLSYTLVWKVIPDEVQNAAIQLYGMQGYIEIVVLSGFYQMFAAINQGFDIQPD